MSLRLQNTAYFFNGRVLGNFAAVDNLPGNTYEELNQAVKKFIHRDSKPMNSPLAKRLIDADTQTLIDAGFLDESLNLTHYGMIELQALLFLDKKAEMLAIATKVLDEKKGKKKELSA